MVALGENRRAGPKGRAGVKERDMSHVWIENGPASRRTLILCMILGLSVAVHRVVVGTGPSRAPAEDQLASAVARSGAPAAPAGEPAKPAQGSPAAPTDETAPAAREPRVNPYARRLWVIDPFRAPNMLRRDADGKPLSAVARPVLNEARTKEVLARTTVEHAVLPGGATHVSITMPGVTAPGSAPALAPEPPRPISSPTRAGRSRPTTRPGATGNPIMLSPSLFAFAGHDLTREESRRWTLALAFEGRGE